jgi:nicotinamidase-related amidase
MAENKMSSKSEAASTMSRPKKDTSLLGKSPVLMVIDVQHEFIDSDGAVPCPATSVPGGPKEVVDNIRRLVNAAKISNIPTVFTKEIHRPSMIDMGRELDGNEPKHCLEGTKGPVLMEELGAEGKLAENQYLVPKRRYSAFIGTDLVFLLNAFKADTLILTGAATNVCVHYTGADAHQYDYRIKVVEEATAGTSPESHKAALQSLEYLQNGAIVHMDEVIEAMKSFRRPKE